MKLIKFSPYVQLALLCFMAISFSTNKVVADSFADSFNEGDVEAISIIEDSKNLPENMDMMETGIKGVFYNEENSLVSINVIDGDYLNKEALGSHGELSQQTKDFINTFRPKRVYVGHYKPYVTNYLYDDLYHLDYPLEVIDIDVFNYPADTPQNVTSEMNKVKNYISWRWKIDKMEYESSLFAKLKYFIGCERIYDRRITVIFRSGKRILKEFMMPDLVHNPENIYCVHFFFANSSM